jgi:hypothetical protein
MSRDYHNGQRIKITGTVGDNESGSLKGETGSVLGVNATFTNKSGVDMVNVRLDSGAVVAVPQKAIKEKK